MYIALKRPSKPVALALQALNWSVAAMAVAALIGSLWTFADAAKHFKPFGL